METSRAGNTSKKISYVLTALMGILGQIALGIYYSGALVPRELTVGNLSAAQLMEDIARNHTLIFCDAYLQGIGTLLSVIFFIKLVYLSDAGNRFSGWLVIITSAVVLTIALVDVTFTVATVTAALAGHTDTMQLATDFITGSTEAFDYTFLFVPAPLLIISLAMVILSSGFLSKMFGYIAIIIGVAFIVVGITSLFATLAGSLGVAFEIVQLTQVMWVLTSAIFVLTYRPKKQGP